MIRQIWDTYGMYWIGMLLGYLLCRWVHRDKIKAHTSSALHNTGTDAICPTCQGGLLFSQRQGLTCLICRSKLPDKQHHA